MNWFFALTWSLTALSLVGMWLNVRHRAECFLAWAVANTGWIAVDAWYGIWSQAFLQCVYLAFSIYGYRQWRNKQESLS